MISILLKKIKSFEHHSKNRILDYDTIKNREKIITVFLVVIVATCHCRTIPNFKIFLNEHFLFVIVALKIFSIKILYILNYLQYLSIELIFLSLSHFLVVIVAKRKIWNIWCDNDNEKYGN